MSTYPDHILRVGSQHLAELKRKAAEFERQLWDAHESLEQELEQAASATDVTADGQQEAFRWAGEAAESYVPGGYAPADRAPAPPYADVDAPGRDPEVFALYTDELLSHDYLAWSMGVRSVERARGYTWSTAAARLRQLYADLTVGVLVDCS